jgi:hypothetical protein
VRKIIRFVAAILATLTLTGLVMAPQVSAQTPEPVDSAFDVFTSLAGFESGAVRVFSSEATASSVTASTDATAEASPVSGGATEVITFVLQFDSDANAISAMAKAQTEIQGESAATSFVVGDLGDKKSAFTLEDETGTVTGSTIVVQVGDQVVVVLIQGAEAEDLAIELAQSIVGTEAGAGEPQFSADGTSTGGLWDRLPTADTASLSGLPVVEDMELQPTQG